MSTTTVVTDKKPAAAKAAPAPPTPVSTETETSLKTMREELTSSRLGHLGRRIEMLVRDSQETIDTYGSKVIVAKLAGQDVRLPVTTTITQTVSVECNGVRKDYSFTTTTIKRDERPEQPLDNFPSQ